LIFFVTFFYQEKKVKALFSKGISRIKYQIFILQKSKNKLFNHLIDYGFNLIKTITK